MATPTLSECKTIAEDIIKKNFEITGDLGGLFLQPLSNSLAGMMRLLYSRVDFVLDQAWYTSASGSSLGGKLDDYAATKGINRVNGTYGDYTVEFTSEYTVVQAIPIGTRMKLGDNVYKTTTSAPFIDKKSICRARCLSAGAETVLVVGDILTTELILTGISPEVEVKTVVALPTDTESDESLIDRIDRGFNESTNGGSSADYRSWSRDLPLLTPALTSVRDIYPYVDPDNIGDLLIYVEALNSDNLPTVASTAQKNGLYTDNSATATDGDVIVRDGVLVIDPDTTKEDFERGRMPIVGGSKVSILDIIIEDVDIEVNGLILNNGDDETTVRNNITDAIKAYVYNIRPFVTGADDANNQSNILRVSDVSNTVRNILSGLQTFSDIVMWSGGSEVVSISYTLGRVPNPKVTF